MGKLKGIEKSHGVRVEEKKVDKENRIERKKGSLKNQLGLTGCPA